MKYPYFDGPDFADERPSRASKGDEPTWMMDKPQPIDYGSTSNIDLDRALAEQYGETEAFRKHMLNNVDAVKPTDVTAALAAVNRVIAQITALKEKVQNMARMQAFENAVVEIMKEQPESVRTAFFSLLEEKLKEVA